MDLTMGQEIEITIVFLTFAIGFTTSVYILTRPLKKKAESEK